MSRSRNCIVASTPGSVPFEEVIMFFLMNLAWSRSRKQEKQNEPLYFL